MSAYELLLVRFLLASGGCLVAGCGVWSLTALCRRHLPELSLQRSLWLLSQVTVVASFLVILLPHSERLRLVPPIELPETRVIRSIAAQHGHAMQAPAATVAAASAPTTRGAWLARCGAAWLLVYLSGLGYAVLRQVRARRLLNSLAAAGSQLRALDQHDGFRDPQPHGAGPAVIEVDAPISPLLFGLLKPRLLLPRHLRRFEPLQQQLIIAHELTHLRRRDLHWMNAGLALQTLLWFNPFMRLLRSRLAWAQELGCDRDVLRGRPPAQRKAYAAALVAQLRPLHRPAPTALAFGAVSANTLGDRIALIRDAGGAAPKRWARYAGAAGLALVFGASLAFQPALTSGIDPAPAMPLATPATTSWPGGSAASTTAFSCTLLADAASGRPLVKQGACDTRATPASTFNIAVSLMGYDSGILRDEHTPRMAYKAGYSAWDPTWRMATDPSDWLRKSVVWYAQQVTAQLGAARFQHYVTSFGYGNRDVSGDRGKDNGLSLSWLSSSLQISPAEQVAFLARVVNRQLPVSAQAYDMTIRIMPSETLANGWQIHGKTGTAANVLPDGRDDREHQYGWYVGWASKGQRTIVFARLVLDQRQDSYAGGRVKDSMLRDLGTKLDTL